MDNFGSRLRHFRENAGLTGRALEAMSGVDNVRISRIENGLVQNVKAFEVAQLCAALGVLPSELVREPKEREGLKIAARKTPGVNQEEMDMYVQRAIASIEFLSRMSGLGIEPSRVPHFPLASEKNSAWAESAAIEVRQMLDLDEEPIDELEERIETVLNVVVEARPLPNSIDALCAEDTQSELMVMVVNSAKPRSRYRFSVAHELGHLVMRKFGIDASGQTRSNVEKAADEFARHLLLPRSVLKPVSDSLLDSALEIESLAHKYGVSTEVVAIQLERAGFVAKDFVDSVKRFKSSASAPVAREHQSRILNALAMRALLVDGVSEEVATRLGGLSEEQLQLVRLVRGGISKPRKLTAV